MRDGGVRALHAIALHACVHACMQVRANPVVYPYLERPSRCVWQIQSLIVGNQTFLRT